MALTQQQLEPILKERFPLALDKHIHKKVATGEANKTGEMLRIAHETGTKFGTFKTRVYNGVFPEFCEWISLCMVCPGIQQDVLGGIMGDGGETPDLTEQVRTLRAMADDLERQAAPKLPLEEGADDLERAE